MEANFKEGQLRKMRIGQPVKMNADLYGTSVTYHGTIAGWMAPALRAAARQNATGNWIKVVQRVPVRITLDPEDLKKHAARGPVDGSGSRCGQAGRRTADAGRTQGTGLVHRAFEPAHGEIDAMVAKIIRDNLDTSDAVASAASAGPAR